MGRKSWLSSVKKAFSPSSKEKKIQKANKSNNTDVGTERSLIPDSPALETVGVSDDTNPLPREPLDDLPREPLDEVTLTEEIVEDEQTKHAYNVAAATAAAAEAAVAAAQAAAEAVRLTEVTQYSGRSKEEVAAIKIQTAFRGYLARRALRALRGLVRLKSLVEGSTVKRQTTNTLKCMQGLSRVQSQINSRRIRMAEENQALQRQLLQKRAKEIENLQMGDEWDDSFQSKEQTESKLMGKYEAAMRRERALAYSFSHQQPWKKTAKSTNLLFMDPTNPQWGWSWLERYMAARPWETRNTTDKDSINDHSSVKSANITGNEIAKSYARHQLNSDRSPTTTAQPRPPFSVTRKLKPKPVSPRGSPLGPDDDSKSVFSVQSERNRRHSVGGGSSVRDDESLASSPSVPSYMAATKSAKAKSRTQSPLGPTGMVENGGNGTPEKGPAGSAKKRLSFPASPGRLPRRHSGPPKIESSTSITGVAS